MQSDDIKLPRFKRFYDLANGKGPVGYAKDLDCMNKGVYLSRWTVEYAYVTALLELAQRSISEGKDMRVPLQAAFHSMGDGKYENLEIYWHNKALENGMDYEKSYVELLLGLEDMEVASKIMYGEDTVENTETMEALEKEQMELIAQSKTKITATATAQAEEVENPQVALFEPSQGTLCFRSRFEPNSTLNLGGRTIDENYDDENYDDDENCNDGDDDVEMAD